MQHHRRLCDLWERRAAGAAFSGGNRVEFVADLARLHRGIAMGFLGLVYIHRRDRAVGSDDPGKV